MLVSVTLCSVLPCYCSIYLRAWICTGSHLVSDISDDHIRGQYEGGVYRPSQKPPHRLQSSDLAFRALAGATTTTQNTFECLEALTRRYAVQFKPSVEKIQNQIAAMINDNDLQRATLALKVATNMVLTDATGKNNQKVIQNAV